MSNEIESIIIRFSKEEKEGVIYKEISRVMKNIGAKAKSKAVEEIIEDYVNRGKELVKVTMKFDSLKVEIDEKDSRILTLESQIEETKKTIENFKKLILN